MGKKKRNHPDAEEILARPWCYYCERDFDDLKILISHQKAKHFKCDRCGRRLNTAGGLSVHLNQVHKENLTAVENALPNRSNLDVEIFGMEGIPDDVLQAHNQRVLSQLQQAEAERRAATGNPPPGASGGNGPKKPKFESPAELKKRLAEHKARVAEGAAGGSSGGGTPNAPSHGNQSPGVGQSPGIYAGSPPYPQAQQPYGAQPDNSTYASYPQPYNQHPAPYQPQSAYASPPPPQQGLQHHGGQYPVPPNQQYPPLQGPQPGHQYAPPGPLGFPSQYQGGPPRNFEANSSPVPFQPNHQPPRLSTPPQNGSVGHRSALPPPAVLGLPQRPSFTPPSVNAFQMQKMHQGQPLPTQSIPSAWPQTYGGEGNSNGQDQQRRSFSELDRHSYTNATSIDDLVSDAARNAEEAAAKASAKVADKPIEVAEKKKKDKDKAMRLVYSDNETSPEEKMARLPRYAFVPERRGDLAMGTGMNA